LCDIANPEAMTSDIKFARKLIGNSNRFVKQKETNEANYENLRKLSKKY
jgi:hypothetical protein